mmetsp:Transcript_117671/g.333491  ORF Transcript_117671/g.333491 Transcript_117671/m.333491 type:complete len:674 (-) Transcript_117671:179-2200(-)
MAPRQNIPACPWNGVSLGGWLLLEPGPSFPLFGQHLSPHDGSEARCEWDLMKIMRQTLGKKQAAEALKLHRDNHITKNDFERIRKCGLNAVRLPFGYWVVAGPASNEPYIGPALEYIDQAVDWAEEFGLQIVLDLHGCPGGESGDAPCGRRMRPVGRWHWGHWRLDESLEVLKFLAGRYASRKCVTGIEVCNEPSNTVSNDRLIRYYNKAINAIRQAGMPSSRVAVICPLFQRPEDAFMRKWQTFTGGKHKNVTFDVHLYHCFENEFNGKTLAQQLRHVQQNAIMLQKYPMVVGEWSLALGCAAWATCGSMDDDEVYKLFGSLQMEALKEATHGHFYWNWTEDPASIEWNFQMAWKHGLFSGVPRLLPWDGAGEDPMEELLHPPPSEPRVLLDEPIYLRVFHGRYIDIEGSRVQARWPDKGCWQQLSFCTPADEAYAASRKGRREIRSGDVVRVRTRSGRFLSVAGHSPEVCAVSSRSSTDAACTEFVIQVQHTKVLRHNGTFFLRSCANSLMVDADEDDEGISARYPDRGLWQQLAVEKIAEDAQPATPVKHTPPPRTRKEEESMAPVLVTPTKKSALPSRRRVTVTAVAAICGGPVLPVKSPGKFESPKSLKRRHESPAHGHGGAGGRSPQHQDAAGTAQHHNGALGTSLSGAAAARGIAGNTPAKMLRVR